MFMKKAIVLAMIAGGFGMAATAEGHDQVAFNYNPQASAEQIHADLRVQAREVCRERTGYPSAIKGVYPVAEWACIRDLMNDAVKAANRPELTKVHNEYVDPTQPYRVAGVE